MTAASGHQREAADGGSEPTWRSDTASSLNAALGSILATGPVNTEGRPAWLGRIDVLRSLGQRIAEDEDASDSERAVELRRVFRLARRSEMSEWVIDAVRAETAYHVHRQPRPSVTEADAAERLRRLGFARCPACVRPVLGPFEIQHLRVELELWERTEAGHLSALAGGAA
jgi:hypothetical protein